MKYVDTHLFLYQKTIREKTTFIHGFHPGQIRESKKVPCRKQAIHFPIVGKLLHILYYSGTKEQKCARR